MIHKICFALSIALIVGGFFSPPIGVIDGSVLTAVGLLILFATIDKLPALLKSGKSIKLQKGDFSAEVSSETKDQDN